MKQGWPREAGTANRAQDDIFGSTIQGANTTASNHDDGTVFNSMSKAKNSCF
jgi:hypothetical protein